MNWYKKALGDLRFENDHIDHHHGQNDFNLVAKIGDDPVGLLEYSEYHDEIFINHIMTHHQMRRQGIATKMIEEMKRLYPGAAIHWGLMTDDGYKLKQSLERT